MKIYNEDYCAACYFRTIAEYPNRKCLIQLTEKCNLRCKHCFVSADNSGKEMDYEKIKENIVPQLVQNNVKKVTLTGGEPFVYERLYDVISLLCTHEINVSICTNATLISKEFLSKISKYQAVHFNVSLDGFSSNSHGKFRGNMKTELYKNIIRNVKLLGQSGLLNGILVTPNIYSSIEEYINLCNFAKECGANYVLMNPLSQFGRGEKSIKLAFDQIQMNKLRSATEKFGDEAMEMVYIRFPNNKNKPLGKCVAGKIMYIFTNGDIAYCPYMVFAAKDRNSLYEEQDFILGNIFEKDFDWNKSLEQYIFPVKYNEVCFDCDNASCRKGCYAAKIAKGRKLESSDDEVCPK